MSTAQVDRWVDIARTVFPADAQITHPPAGESVWLRVRWKIGTDPKRPQKLAKGVNIYFTREFCKAYGGLDATRQSDWDSKLGELFASKYATFNPDHNAPHGTPMPADSWFVTPGSVRQAP
jgi:hypothetical protein